MRLEPTDTLERILQASATAPGSWHPILDGLVNLFHVGRFQVFEQVASDHHGDRVTLVATRGTGEAPLILLCPVTLPDPDPLEPPTITRLDPQGGPLNGPLAGSGLEALAAAVAAASGVDAESLERPVCVVATLGEGGTTSGLEDLLAHRDLKASAAVVASPTGLLPAWAHPGRLVVELQIQREVTHRRMPPTRGLTRIRIQGDATETALNRVESALDKLGRHGEVHPLWLAAGDRADLPPARAEMVVATSYEDLPDLPPWASQEPLEDGVALPFPLDDILEAWGVMKAALDPAPTPGRLRTGRDQVVGCLSWPLAAGEIPTEEVRARLLQVRAANQASGGSLAIRARVRESTAAWESAHKHRVLLGPLLEAAGLPDDPSLTTNGVTEAALLEDSGCPVAVWGPGAGPGAPGKAEDWEAFHGQLVKVIERWCLPRT